MGEWIEHVGVLLPRRPAACRQKIPFCIHITNTSSVSVKGFDIRKRVRVEDVNATGLSSCAYVLTCTLHDGILGFGWKLHQVSL